MKTCRSCRAEVVFAKHVGSGRVMILDAEPHAEGTVVLRDGRCLTYPQAKVVELRRAGVALHRDHHASCPFVARHRQGALL